MRLWRGASLRARLFTAIGLAVVLSIGLTLGLGLVLTRRAVESAALDDVARQANLLAGQERASVAPLFHLKELRPFLQRQHERVLSPAPLRSALPAYMPESARADLAAGRVARGRLHLDGEAWYFAGEPVGAKAFVLLRPKRLSGADWHPFVEGLLVAALVGASLALVVSLLLARAIRRPVTRIAAATRSLAAGEEHRELPVEGSDELAQLSRSFNDMAAQLATAREAEQAFLLSVSHELKTPLTSIRGYAEGLEEGAIPLEEAAEVIRGEARRLERLVQDLLDLARVNRHAFAVRREEVDLAETARDAGRRYEGPAQAFGLTLEVDSPDEAPAVGDADRVLQVLSNLVENALRCTLAGGRVRVLARPGELQVADTGPGLAAEDLPRAFERFFLYRRHGADRPVGTGLGLAIVKELTEAMGGRVDVRSRLGEGTTFRVRLPLPQAAVDGGALQARRGLAPQQGKPALLNQDAGQGQILRETAVAVDDPERAGRGEPVGDRDDVVLHPGLDGPA